MKNYTQIQKLYGFKRVGKTYMAYQFFVSFEIFKVIFLIRKYIFVSS